MTHASTPRLAVVTAACRSTDLPSPWYGGIDQSLERYPNIHRTTRLESPTEDTTSDTAPQPNVSDTAGAVAEEQAPSEPPPETQTPVESVQPLAPPRKKARMVWPRGSGAPGFGRYRGTKWYDFETEEQDEHGDPPLPATTSNTRRSFPVPKYRDRHLETEQSSDSKLPEPNKENIGAGKMSSEPESPDLPDHFDFRPDTSSEGSNAADHEPIPNARYPKYCIDEFEDLEEYMKAYVRYRIAGSRMKFNESDTGSEQHYSRFPGIELDEIGEWAEDRNNVAPCEYLFNVRQGIRQVVPLYPSKASRHPPSNTILVEQTLNALAKAAPSSRILRGVPTEQ